MKFYATLCAVALVLEVCLGQSTVPLPGINSGLAAESVVNSVLSSVPTALPQPDITSKQAAESLVNSVLSSVPTALPQPDITSGQAAESVVNSVLSSIPTALPLPDITSGLPTESVVNKVLSSVPIALPLPAVPIPVVPTAIPTPVPAPATTPATPDAFYLSIQSLVCEKLQDIELIISTKVTEVIDEGGILADWFPDDIATNLNNTVYNAHSKLVEHVKMIVNITSEFDDELDRAVEIAGSKIGMETERIDGDERITALLKLVPDAFKDPIVISKGCEIAKRAAVTAHVLQDGLYACEKALKYAIIPNVDKITDDLETLSRKIITIDKDTDDDSSILPLVTEIQTLYATVENALAADKDIVTNAGLALTKCVVDLINTAKKETDNEYNDMKALVPSQMLSDISKEAQLSMPAPIQVAEPATPAPVMLAPFPAEAAPSMPLPTVPVEAAPSMPLPTVPVAAVPSMGLPTVPSMGLPTVPSMGLPTVPSMGLPTVPSMGLPTVPVA